jgi:hypothetical protein
MGVGTFSITVSRAGYEPATIEHAELKSDGCELVGQEYTLVLRRRVRGEMPEAGD